MKVISFFSAEGGTGKTTFNVLLASYIKYRLGKLYRAGLLEGLAFFTG